MTPRHLFIATAVAGLAGTALAQYKIVAPDGSVTYTDRPPVTETGRVQSIGRSGAATPAPRDDREGGLPFELRQVASRYPVTLYAAANCIPCDNGRQLLLQRGIPYTERRIESGEDTAALERLAGGRTVPALTVGAQALRGFNATDWGSYLDAAGYPRESRLPRGWQTPPVTPLVAREPAPVAAAAPPTAPAPAFPSAPAAPAPPASGPGIRF
jgi:glutaredoxin